MALIKAAAKRGRGRARVAPGMSCGRIKKWGKSLLHLSRARKRDSRSPTGFSVWDFSSTQSFPANPFYANSRVSFLSKYKERGSSPLPTSRRSFSPLDRWDLLEVLYGVCHRAYYRFTLKLIKRSCYGRA